MTHKSTWIADGFPIPWGWRPFMRTVMGAYYTFRVRYWFADLLREARGIELAAAVALALIVSAPAYARPRTARPEPTFSGGFWSYPMAAPAGTRIVRNEPGRRASKRAAFRRRSGARRETTSFRRPGEATVVGSRPTGCPHAFCGCEASLYLFHKIVPRLNLAANWYGFGRAAPAVGMAAVRPHHVMVLISHVEGDRWLVHDGNSGRHLTREHVRSIRGYTIVNPNKATSRGEERFSLHQRRRRHPRHRRGP